MSDDIRKRRMPCSSFQRITSLRSVTFCKARRLTWARPFSTNVFLMQVRLVCTLGFLSRRVLFRQQYPRLMMGKLGVCSGPPSEATSVGILAWSLISQGSRDLYDDRVAHPPSRHSPSPSRGLGSLPHSC